LSTAETCARAAAAIIGAGIVLTSLGQLAARRDLAPGGFYDWSVVRARRGWTDKGLLAAPLAALFSYPRVLAITVVQAIAALALVVGYPALTTVAALPILVVTQVLLRVRFQWGTDGADQIMFIVVVGLLAFYVCPPGALRETCLAFIGAETVLCYFSAGVAKALDPGWRNGTAVPMIVRSREFGLVRLSALVDRNEGLGKLLCWSTIAWETSAPAFVALGPRTCLGYLAAGIVFHVSVAVVMGLNDFVLSFVATYPAVYFLSTLVARA
jgi:hypothetical protein